MEKTIVLDDEIAEDLQQVRRIVSNIPANAGPSLSSFMPSLYKTVIEELSDSIRNTPSQIEYLSAYESALSVFRVASLELRRGMDILTLEQRLSSNGNDDNHLKSQINDAIMFSNRYSLFFAGNVGLALLGSSPASTALLHSFGTSYDSSKDRDDLTRRLTTLNTEDFQRIIAEKKSKSEPVSDEDLKYSLELIFTSWINQFKWSTFKDVATSFRIIIAGSTRRSICLSR